MNVFAQKMANYALLMLCMSWNITEIKTKNILIINYSSQHKKKFWKCL